MLKENRVITSIHGLQVNALFCEESYYVVYHKDLQHLINVRNASYWLEQPSVKQYKDTTMVICTCTMKDPVTQRTVAAVGESDDKNLYSQVEILFPAEVAANRAFDRAAIQLLGFRERVYSSSELPSSFFEETAETGPMMQNQGNPAPAPNGQPMQASKPMPDMMTQTAQNTAPAPGAANAVARVPRPPMPEGMSDKILIGSLKGKSYKENKDSYQMSKLINFLKGNQQIVYPTEDMQKQAAFFRQLT